MDAAQVEEYAHAHGRIGRRGGNPAPHFLLPGRQRLPPLFRFGHDFAGAVDIAAGVETITNHLRQALVPGQVLGLYRVIDDNAVVLVSPQQLLGPRLGAETHPAPGHWRRAQPLLSDLDETHRHGIADGGEYLADLLGSHAGIDPLHHEVGHTGNKAFYSLYIVLARDMLHQVNRVVLFCQDQVRGGDDTLEFAIQHDRQVMVGALGHQQGGGENALAGINGFRVGCHDVTHRGIGRQGQGDEAHPQVAVRHDAGQPALLDHECRGDPARGHHLGGVLHRVGGFYRQQIGAHHGAHLLHHGVGFGLVAGRPAQAPTALAGEVAVEVAIALPQALVGFIGQQVQQRVLDDSGLHLALFGVQPADMKTLTLPQPVQQLVVAVAYFNRAAAHDAQPLLGRLPVEQLAAAVVLHPYFIHHRVELGLAQLVEGQRLFQEFGNRHQFRHRKLRHSRLLCACVGTYLGLLAHHFPR